MLKHALDYLCGLDVIINGFISLTEVKYYTKNIKVGVKEKPQIMIRIKNELTTDIFYVK
jgi:predicted DNA-binding ArsR family transcriptional regulator